MPIKLARKRVPVESACGYTTLYDLRSIEALVEAGRVAKLIRAGRRPGGAVVRVMLLALPGELAHRSPQSTTYIPEGLTTTWVHRSSHRAGL